MGMRRARRGAFALVAAAITAFSVVGCSGTASAPNATYDPEEKVTLNFAFWGNDVRAGLYDQAIAAFNEEYPNISVNTSFLDFPAFWEKRQTEAAGGGLPDVMQFDYSYLRQYSENGLLLDLAPYLGGIIDTEPLSDNVLQIGVVGDQTTAIPTSTNAWGLFLNPTLLQEVGIAPYAGSGSWEDYDSWMQEVSAAAALSCGAVRTTRCASRTSKSTSAPTARICSRATANPISRKTIFGRSGNSEPTTAMTAQRSKSRDWKRSPRFQASMRASPRAS